MLRAVLLPPFEMGMMWSYSKFFRLPHPSLAHLPPSLRQTSRRTSQNDFRNLCSSVFHLWLKTNLHSFADKVRHWPAGKSPSRKFPIRTRINRKVGCPMAAVIRRTWRFLPSINSSPIQQSGTLLRNRIGGWRGESFSVAASRLRAAILSGKQSAALCRDAATVAAPESTRGKAWCDSSLNPWRQGMRHSAPTNGN